MYCLSVFWKRTETGCIKKRQHLKKSVAFCYYSYSLEWILGELKWNLE